MDDAQQSAADIEKDARDLRRGVLINIIGYAVKIAYPILTGLVIYLYGKDDFGTFIAAQAVLLISMRVALLGFDKGVLWWVPRQPEGSGRQCIRAVLVLTGITSTAAAVAIGFLLAPVLADWRGEPDAELGLRWMTAGLVPMTLMEVLIHGCLGKRRIEAQVMIKEGLVSISLVLLGVVFFLAGFRTNGLATAFVISNSLGLVAAAIFFNKIFRHTSSDQVQERIPRLLWRYTLPMWLTEMANSVLIRMDVLLLAAMESPGIVGVYGAVVQIGNALRSVRHAFDPIVLAIMSQIGAAFDKKRLIAGFSHATCLVIATQLPIYAFLIVFTPWILPLLGEGYDQAALAVFIICGFWILNGVVGLNGLIVNGYGRSDLALFNALLAIAVQALLLWLLIPRYGLEGAAAAVGLAYTFQNLVQSLQARAIAGVWAYNESVLWILGAGGLAVVAMGGAWFAFSFAGISAGRIGGFVVFLAVFAPLLYRLYHVGYLSGRGLNGAALRA